MNNVRKAARRKLTDMEFDALMRVANGEEERMRKEFLQTWTNKEAFVKCTGEGLRRDLKTVEVGIGEELDSESRLIAVDGSQMEAAKWCLKSLSTKIADEDIFLSLVAAAPVLQQVAYKNFLT